MSRASRRRSAAIRALRAALSERDTGMAEHIYDAQLRPQERVRELRARGYEADGATVDVSPDAKGYLVTCYGCGRSARLPFEPPAGKGVLCPGCQERFL